MTKKETLQIITYLREAFPNGTPITEQTVNVWHDILGEYDYKIAWECMRQVAKEWEGYTMPPPATIIKKMNKVGAEDTYIDLWNEAEKLIRKGTVLTGDEFRQASKEVQRYFGNVARIRDLALMPPEQTANERARFLKQIPEICEHYRLREKLPEEVLAVIDGVSERKQLCE